MWIVKVNQETEERQVIAVTDNLDLLKEWAKSEEMGFCLAMDADKAPSYDYVLGRLGVEPQTKIRVTETAALSRS